MSMNENRGGHDVELVILESLRIPILRAFVKCY
jgi:hypothetical protein